MSEEKGKKINVSTKSLSGKFLPPQSDDKVVTYPSSKNLKINHNALKLELINFSEAIRKEPNFEMFLILTSLWIAVLTASFNDFLSFKGKDIKVFFFTITSIFTLLILKRIFFMLVKCVSKFNYVLSRYEYFRKWVLDNETDPQIKADNIIKKALENEE